MASARPVRLETVHDDVAKVSRITLEVGASDVDIVGIVVYSGFVSMLSYVARPE